MTLQLMLLCYSNSKFELLGFYLLAVKFLAVVLAKELLVIPISVHRPIQSTRMLAFPKFY